MANYCYEHERIYATLRSYIAREKYGGEAKL